jgi:hypothetical protein
LFRSGWRDLNSRPLDPQTSAACPRMSGYVQFSLKIRIPHLHGFRLTNPNGGQNGGQTHSQTKPGSLIKFRLVHRTGRMTPSTIADLSGVRAAGRPDPAAHSGTHGSVRGRLGSTTGGGRPLRAELVCSPQRMAVGAEGLGDPDGQENSEKCSVFTVTVFTSSADAPWRLRGSEASVDEAAVPDHASVP